MNRQMINEVVHQTLVEAAEDDVGLREVVNSIRTLAPGVQWTDMRLTVAEVCKSLVGSGLDFGRVDPSGRFESFGTDADPVYRILVEMSDLGRDPDIGEIGWFRAPWGDTATES